MRAWAEGEFIVPLEYWYVAEEDGRVIRLHSDY